MANYTPIPVVPTQNSRLPLLTAIQASGLLKSSLAIASELIGNALGPICKMVDDNVARRRDYDVGAIMLRRLIHDRLAEFRDVYLEELRVRQDEALNEALLPPQYNNNQKVIEDQLSLVDASTMSTKTVASSIGSRIFGRVEDQSRALMVVLQYLTGKQNLRASSNPFAPEVFIQSLVNTMERLGLDPEAWDFCLKSFEEPLSDEILRIHQSLIDHFRQHGLDVKEIRRELTARQAAERAAGSTRDPLSLADPTSAGKGAGADSAGGPATVPGGPRIDQPAADPNIVLNALVALLQANAHGMAIQSMPRSSPPSQGLMNAIGEFQQLNLQGLSGATLSSEAAGKMTGWRGHLIEESTRTVDKLTIELVGMLFDHLMQDKQVPAEIKALISRLQFPVLKAALMDADFFATNNHPARRMIDRFASTAAGWEPYGDENERYRAEVERIVKEVLAKFEKDVSIFEKLLNEFEAFIGEIPQRDADPVARAKRALEEAEKREILVINTTIQVRRAFEKVELEPYLREFLVGPWVQVLVAATLRDSQTPGFSKRFREAIHDLVWSVLPKANNEDRKRLTQLIPTLIRVLRDGMALIKMAEHEQQTVLRQLMESHAMAVKPVDQATYIKSSLVTTEVKNKLDGLQITGTHPITTVAGGIRVSTGAVMRAAQEFNADVHMPELATDIGNLDRVEEAQMDAEIASWQRGTWFEFWDGAKMIKARLRWISPLRTLFLFSANGEKDAHVLPPNVIKSYLKRNYIKPVESVPLMKRAVDRVVGQFERQPKLAQELAERYVPTVGG